jgi:hypothetical protein
MPSIGNVMAFFFEKGKAFIHYKHSTEIGVRAPEVKLAI